ncbi:CDP-alcohol phosphatidyltransferase family protein [Candidatus Parcubacteria bacterium]|nr:CDP-alcohol phosphatidyltransferase family protein [Candidatus Parcubacteria bacterium]
MLDLHRNLFKGLEKKVGKIFSFLPITPNQWTLISILFAFVCLYFLIKQNLILAIVFFLIAGFLDFIDGAVARYKNMATKIGAYLDTIADRYVEAILLFGMLFLPLPKIFLPSYAWIFLILFGSIMTTYAKAAAKEKNLVCQELKGGLLSRGERIILLLVCLILGVFNFYWMVYVLILIAILANFTALQRILAARKDGVIFPNRQKAGQK